MIFHFLNGTPEQHARFRAAVELCKANLLAVNAQVEISWVADPGPAGGEDLADTAAEFDGLNWKGHIHLSPMLEAQDEPFYRECVIHELAHLLHSIQFDQAEINRVCEMYGRPASEWADPGLPWERRIQENLAELLKDAMLDPSLRRYSRNERVAYDFPAASWDELLNIFTPELILYDNSQFTLASSGELDLVEASPSPLGGITRYLYTVRMTDVPFYGMNHYYRGVLRILDPSSGVPVNSDYILFRVDGRFAVNDGELSELPDFNFNAGGRVPPGSTLVWLDTSGALDFELAELNDSLWAWERTPIDIGLEVRFNLEASSSFHPTVTTTLEFSNHPGFPFIPRLPYPALEKVLVPSSITAHPGEPGTRRIVRTVVGS